MAAILPHLEQPDEVTPVERAYAACVTSLAGPGLGEDHEACPTPDETLAQAHAGLLQMVFLRDVVVQGLQGRGFTVQIGNRSGKDKRNVYLVLEDGGIGPGPAWNPTTDPRVSQYKLLSWTSKMNAPSWSLPAGAPQIGGACPGAVAGQSVVPVAALTAARKHVNAGLNLAPDTPVNLPQAICEHCYATGGQYSTGSVQFAQTLRYMWAREAIDVPAVAPDGSPSTAFVETMVYAIANANFKLNGGTTVETEAFVDEDGNVVEREVTQKLPPEVVLGADGTPQRFFRIHDSGDFFSRQYLAQWKQIADRLPQIIFWAPSRIWATSWGVEAVNQINAQPRNLIIRPSAYQINEAGPVELGDGWAAPTTVISLAQNNGMAPDRAAYVEGFEQHGPALREELAALTSKSGKLTEAQTKRKAAIERQLDLIDNPRTDPRYTWDCRAYSTDDQKHTCRKAVPPPGYGNDTGHGCRACWIAPGEIINYTLH